VPDRLTRRRLLEGAALAPAALVLAQCGGEDKPPRKTLAATPACDDHAPTQAETEGPYFTPGSPERTSLLEAGVRGTPLLLSGRVLDARCRPLRSALLDFWQADGGGVYDNDGYRLRGHQFTDAAGRYRLATVVPGLYPGRTRHVHVKVQQRGGQVLTTQLYFPGEPVNQQDSLYDAALEMKRSGRRGSFDFVLAA
jgi:protocatechuate 3,4-dioxygenase beta subunit